MSNERQLAEPTASLAQRTEVTATSGGLPSGQTTGRTYNPLRISTEPMFLLMIVTLFGLPADLVLDVTGAVDVPPVLRGVIWGYSALSFMMLFVYGYVESQYS